MANEEKMEMVDLVEFINQCPFGLIKADPKGNIILLNAHGSKLLLPIAMHTGEDLSNILRLLESIDPELAEKVYSFTPDYGIICDNHRLKIRMSEMQETQYLSFTIIRINSQIYQYSFKDVANVVKTENRMRETAEITALQTGKLEIATGILHDIGNALTAFGSQVAKINADHQWPESELLGRLSRLFETREAALDRALGADKGRSLIKFTDALRDDLDQRQEDYRKIAKILTETTGHVQEIINIQHQYVRGQPNRSPEPLELQQVLDDAFAIQERSLEVRQIQVMKNIPTTLPRINGDKTRLVQVMINVIKNAAEAFERISDHRQRQLIVSAVTEPETGMLSLSFKDNGRGFELDNGSDFLKRGVSSKNGSAGIGLYNCRQIIEAHQGTIDITSPGEDQGACLSIRLPFITNQLPHE